MQAPIANSTEASAMVLPEDTLQQYLRLGIGTEMFATSIDAVREILEVSRLTVLPQTPGFVRGVMNLRGAVVPVIDMSARFGGSEIQIGRRSCIVVVDVVIADDPSSGEGRAASHVVGMLVDAVYEVFESSLAEMEPVPEMGTTVAPEFLKAMARVRGQVCGVLSLPHLLSPAVLADLIARRTIN